MKKHIEKIVLLIIASTLCNSVLADPAKELIYTNKHRVKSIAHTNIYNFNARLYDAFTGQFITPDPIRHTNWYRSASNNPLTYIDPSGRDPVSGTAAAAYSAKTLAALESGTAASISVGGTAAIGGIGLGFFAVFSC